MPTVLSTQFWNLKAVAKVQQHCAGTLAGLIQAEMQNPKRKVVGPCMNQEHRFSQLMDMWELSTLKVSLHLGSCKVGRQACMRCWTQFKILGAWSILDWIQCVPDQSTLLPSWPSAFSYEPGLLTNILTGIQFLRLWSAPCLKVSVQSCCVSMRWFQEESKANILLGPCIRRVCKVNPRRS